MSEWEGKGGREEAIRRNEKWTMKKGRVVGGGGGRAPCPTQTSTKIPERYCHDIKLQAKSFHDATLLTPL